MKLDEIARLAGVSRTTASYVINGKARQYRVSEKTIAKVLAVVEEYNYQPNAVAAGLRAGKTHSIGLIIPDLANNSYAMIANYLEQLARKEGYQLLIACSEDLPDNEKACANHLMQRKVDALIVASCLPPDTPFYQRKMINQIPIIAFDRFLDPEHYISVVGNDEDDAFILAKQVKQHVDQNVLYIGALPLLSTNQLREHGFRQAWQGKTECLSFLYAEKYEREAAFGVLSQWLEHNPMPHALYTTSFSLMQGAIDALQSSFSGVPDEMVLATFGDHEFLDFLPCPVLSLAQQHKNIAERLFKLVLSRLDQSSPEVISNGMIRLNRLLCGRGKLREKDLIIC